MGKQHKIPRHFHRSETLFPIPYRTENCCSQKETDASEAYIWPDLGSHTQNHTMGVHWYCEASTHLWVGPNSARTLTKIFFSGNNDKFLGKSVIIRQRHVCSGYSLVLTRVLASYFLILNVWKWDLRIQRLTMESSVHHPKTCATLVKAVITCVVYMRWADGWPWGRHRRSRVTCKHRQPR